MRRIAIFSVCALATVVVAAARAQEAPQKPSRSAQAMAVPRLYVATGPSRDDDLARLKSAIVRLAGVTRVEATAEFGAITVVIDGDGRSTQSLFAAAAKSIWFVLRPVSQRYYRADGPADEAAIAKLRNALQMVHGVDRVDVGVLPVGAALRITAVTPTADLAAVGKTCGYTLSCLASYVVSGSSTESDLARLKSILSKVAAVQQVEVQALKGGATVLVHGDAKEEVLVASAKQQGYALWPLSNGPGARQAVVLPTLEPIAERGTPPDYDNRVIDELAIPGKPAPEFSLLDRDGARTVALGDYLRKKPVVLFFGSCT